MLVPPDATAKAIGKQEEHLFHSLPLYSVTAMLAGLESMHWILS